MIAHRQVIVETHARLHLGFLDLNFGFGRKFGSLGLAVSRPLTRLCAELADDDSVAGACGERLCDIVQRIAPGANVRFAVEDSIPAHSGLGSGTQLALAAAAALQALHGEKPDVRALSPKLGRGARSGLGIGSFEQGGFLVDGGRGADGAPAPIVARLPFPEGWRVLLAFDRTLSGVHGEEETKVFGAIPPVPPELAGEFCRRTLMQILPALAERDLAAFSEGVRAIQDGMGAIFAPYQSGSAFRSLRVREALAWLDRRGIKGIGQSSWGPTGFAFVTEAQGGGLLEEIGRVFAGEEGLSFALVEGCNHGASVTVR
jgi:beta-RFAP synthase